MSGEKIARPEEIPLPASGRVSLQLNENASNHQEWPGGLESNEDNNTAVLKTVSFEAFMNAVFGRRPKPQLTWMGVAGLAFQDLPRGGMFATPVASSPNALPGMFDDPQWTDFYSDSWDALLSKAHPDQVACWNSAEFVWNHWLEDAEKPQLVVFDSAGFQFKDTIWFEDDLTGALSEDTVKLWISRHFLNKLTSPAFLSAEVHIMINSMLDDQVINRNIQVYSGDLLRYMEFRQLASRTIEQHMGPSTNRPLISSRITWFPLFLHRIDMFVARPLSPPSQQVPDAHRRAQGRFPASGSAVKPGRLPMHSFYERSISVVAGFQDAKDGNTLRSVFIIKDEEDEDSEDEFFEDALPVKVCEDLSLEERARFLPELLRQYYLLWEESWNGCLDGIDDSVMITLEDLSEDTKLDTFMFDGPNFERSRSYFAALQLLRIFSDRIKETRQDLIQTIKILGQDGSFFESSGLEEAESRLIQRIDRKTEEIKMLRDGLFNSTSVREATRATEMNRYVIVFTIVTVLYTPPSFISALFATPLPYFTKGDPDDFKRAIGIATGTTVLAAIILLFIANSFDDIIRNPKDRLRVFIALARERGRRVRHAVTSAPQTGPDSDSQVSYLSASEFLTISSQSAESDGMPAPTTVLTRSDRSALTHRDHSQHRDESNMV